MVAEIKDSFKSTLKTLKWMDEGTKKEAFKKVREHAPKLSNQKFPFKIKLSDSTVKRAPWA